MRSLIRWSATLGLIGGILLGSGFAGVQQASALTQEQVLERLRSVPVFTITDAQGAPLVASPSQQQQGARPVAGVFINRQDAETFLQSVRSNNPNIGNVRVTPVSLAEIYELALNNASDQNRVQFTLIPTAQEVNSARSILQQQGEQNAQQFEGVPLFYAESTQDGGGFLTVEQGNQRVIPIFFKQEDLQSMITRASQQQPALGNSLRIQVTNLEGLIQTMQSSDDPDLGNIVLVAPRESIEFVRNLQSQPGGAQNQSRPAQQR